MAFGKEVANPDAVLNEVMNHLLCNFSNEEELSYIRQFSIMLSTYKIKIL